LRALEGARAAAVTHALYLLDPDPAPAWAPFVGARPLCELRAGAHLIRERWETFVGAETAAIFALPHLAGFAEAGVPLVAARRPVPGPAVIGSSTFAPRGLAPALPDGVFRLTSGGVTVGWGVGPGAVWDGPQPHAAAIEVSGVVPPGVCGPVRGSAIGPRTTSRGELSNCVFLGYANKAHDGFVGHCVIGRWANLGAGTITSNLKNTYGRVRLEIAGTRLETGLQLLGSLIG